MTIDACGRLREFRSGPYDASALTASLDPDFFQAQFRVKQAREVLLAMVKAESLIPVDCEIEIDLALQAAYQEGLTDREDVIFYAVNQVTLPETWRMHPATRACITGALSGKSTLVDSFTSLPDDVLEELSTPNSKCAWHQDQLGSV
ncbi:hypothetical protein QFW77_13280 [Luteimonas sp. RD2P54]|uniref:Uncharacterized protein n=1 Tax=Luteimonas endophytica TaxID=3042023 RepID=A0ABT6JAT8_9GAMM|nr:hypothetical protein [Luteimonas endophytica]MDH5823950.1 hypothetical protein [Luteimonas endophytica]